MAKRLPIQEHKIMRSLDALVPRALQHTPRMTPGNQKLACWVYFRENPKNGQLGFEVVLLDPDTDKTLNPTNQTFLVTEDDQQNPGESVGWLFAEIARRAYARVREQAVA